MLEMAEQPIEGRSATAYKPQFSPAVMNVTTYSFGADAESTRPDTVRRMPTASIIIHRRGRLLECHESGRVKTLPVIALLGPSTTAHIWATRPDTEFLMVNLAPGVTRKLFDFEPEDMVDQMESLEGHALAVALQRAAATGDETLHRCLCQLLRAKQPQYCEPDHRVKAAMKAMRDRIVGRRVRDYADHFGVTCRTLQRLVRAEVGLTPKQVLAIERVRALIMLTAGGWHGTTAELAQESGFFDQSHLRYELLRHQMGSVGNLLGGDHILVKNWDRQITVWE